MNCLRKKCVGKVSQDSVKIYQHPNYNITIVMDGMIMDRTTSVPKSVVH